MEVNLFPLFLSLKVALISTVISIIIGLPISYILSKRQGKIIDFVDTLVNLPIVMPPTGLGYYLLTFLGRKSIIGKILEENFNIMIVFTPTGAIIAATIVSMPYIIKSSKAAFLTVNRDYVNAAKLLGKTELNIFFDILLPLSWHGIAAGITMGFVRALGDFGTTLMISGSIPDKTLTMPIAIYNSLQEGNYLLTNILVFIMTAVAIIILFTVNSLERKMKKR